MAHLRSNWLWYAGGAALLFYMWRRQQMERAVPMATAPQPSNALPAVAGFLPSNLPVLPGPGGVVDVSHAMNGVVNSMTPPLINAMPLMRSY